MFKTRGVAAQERRKSLRLRLADCRKDKARELEGSSKITSNRVTIGPGFLCLGVNSRTVSKKNKENLCSERDNILKEDLHSLFNTNLNKRRSKTTRSSRISNRLQHQEDCNDLTAYDYYCNSIESPESNQRVKKRSKEGSFHVPKNKSKSIFRTIEERYSKVQKKTYTNFDYPITPILTPECRVEVFEPTDFCEELQEELRVDLSRKDFLQDTQQAIKDKIDYINDCLEGKMDSDPVNAKRIRTNEPCDVPQAQDNFHFIPKCEWVYETPPSQGVVLPEIEGCAIQPAVICTGKKQSNIFELKPNVKVDLTAFSGRQNVPLDGKYVRHLASFEGKAAATFDFGGGGTRGSDLADLAAGPCDSAGTTNAGFGEFNFPEPPPASVSQLFSAVTCRPTKTVKRLSRVNKLYSRKSSEESVDSTPPGAEFLQTVDELERDITFVEDGGRFKMVERGGVKAKFEFKIRRNLFKGDPNDDGDDRIFKFEEEDVKVFDFSQLKHE